MLEIHNNKYYITVLFLIFIVILNVHSQSFFCSGYCGYDMCNGTTNSSCTGCTAPFVLSGSQCIPGTDYTIVAYPNQITLNVTSTSSCGPYSYAGNFFDGQRVLLSFTITQPHYQVSFVIVVIAMKNWRASDNIFIKDMGGSGINLNYGNLPGLTSMVACNAIGDSYMRASDIWAHTSTTVPINIEVSVDDSNNNPWGIKDYMFLAKLCHTNCKVCSGSLKSQCTACSTGFYLSGTTCDLTCPSGKGYPSSGQTCISCNFRCTQCYYLSSNCTKCDTTSFLDQTTNTCNINCPLYTGANATDRVCYPCIDSTNCKNCTGNTSICITCISSMILYNGACLASCPSGTFNSSNVCVLCDQTCLTCSGTTANDCTACSPSYPYLSGILCNTACLSLYGVPSSGYTCVACNSLCLKCAITSTNCSQCITSAYFKSDTSQCLLSCPIGYIQNSVAKTCDKCSTGCATCINLISNCTTCLSGYSFLIDSCYSPCPNGYYDNAGICQKCDPICQECAGYPGPCGYCSSGYFLDNQACSTSCPTGYFAYQLNRTCLDCSLFCVFVTIDAYFPAAATSSDNPQNIYVDIVFSRSMNFSDFPYKNFQIFSLPSTTNVSIDKFSYSYEILNQTAYRVIVSIIGTASFDNLQVFCTTVSISTDFKSSQGQPLDISAYSQNDTVLWTVMKYPSLQGSSKQVIQSLSNVNNWITSITTVQYVQQMHKAGIFAMLFSGAQATSLAILKNRKPPQNMYEGCRFWAIFIYFDVPDWQSQSNKTKYIIVPSSDDVISSSRLLMNQTDIDFRFRRTGFTTFFLLDCYINIVLLLIAWFALLIGYFLSKKFETIKKRLYLFYSFLHRIHQVSLFYFVISSVLQWMYFTSSSRQRVTSIIFEIIILIYFLGYYLYIYKDLIGYPLASIGDSSYNQYIQKYGFFLKNIRYEEYSRKQTCCYFPYFRPYNFHLFSFYKKVLMLAVLPLFYGFDYAQLTFLAGIQLLELSRVIIIRPFYKLWRNALRIFLQLILFLFFLFSLIDQVLYNQIAADLNSATAQQLQTYENIGWAQFIFIFVFNLTFFALMIFDLITGCIWSNRSRIDQARKEYYLKEFQLLDQKIEKQEQKIDTLTRYNTNNTAILATPKSALDTPKTMTSLGFNSFRSKRSASSSPMSKYSNQQKKLLKKWMKAGNLVQKEDQQLLQTTVKIQEYKIKRHETSQSYQVKIYRAFDLYVHLKLVQGKNKKITVIDQFQKQIVLTQNPIKGKFSINGQKSLQVYNNPYFYKIIDQIYWHYKQTTTQSIIIKTYLNVNLENYNLGQEIKMSQDKMIQAIVQKSFNGNQYRDKLDKPYKPFPIQKKEFEALM